jgi:hypothetical protein
MSRRVITQSEIIDAEQKERREGTILYNETEQKRVSQQSADDTASKIIKSQQRLLPPMLPPKLLSNL